MATSSSLSLALLCGSGDGVGILSRFLSDLSKKFITFYLILMYFTNVDIYYILLILPN